MKTFLKIAVIVIGLLLVLIVVAAVVVPRVVDPNAHKDQIIALVERQTGRRLSIPGNIGISVFPWLGADVGAVELGNAAGFESPVFAKLEHVQVRVKILPLLSKRVEADVVTIRGLTLNLEKAKDGRTNWDDLTKPVRRRKARDRGNATISSGGPCRRRRGHPGRRGDLDGPRHRSENRHFKSVRKNVGDNTGSIRLK